MAILVIYITFKKNFKSPIGIKKDLEKLEAKIEQNHKTLDSIAKGIKETKDKILVDKSIDGIVEALNSLTCSINKNQ